MELANDFNTQFLIEDISLKKVLKDIRDEITNAILSAKTNKAFDKDVCLSFGVIHINPYGSVSEISFNGIDVTNVDQFVVEQALHIKKENFFDIRFEILNNTSQFSFYPISDGKRIYYTLLKNSEYFINKFGDSINDHNRFRIRYTFKYIVISILNDEWEDYVFEIELYDSGHLNRMMVKDAIRQFGLNNNVYCCFSNIRPETLVRIGMIKKHFLEFKKPAEYGFFKFYKGLLENVVLRISKVTDDKNDVLVKNTRRSYIEVIIDACFGGIRNFTTIKNIDEKSLRKYLSGEEQDAKYNDGNHITPSRLDELLNLPSTLNAKDLKNANLLIQVNYEDIPEDYHDFFE